MTHQRVILAMGSMLMFVVLGQWPGQAAAQVTVDVGGVHVQVGERPPPVTEVVVLTRGPVHEAFAQPVTFDEGAGFIITHRPPAPIEEVLPELRPEGGQIVWIPGYWSWDTDRDDFIWVSGCWRAVPPACSWVPGYWAEVRGGYRWIEGFWDTADNEEIEYLPAPPATLEEGPVGPGSPDSVWIPGCWVRYEGRYAWRPGFREQARPNWVWVPAQYVFTPRGWIYVAGYWDYSLDRRGVAFLPVYCPASLYGRRDFRYSPEFVLDLDGLTINLFISPERHHYYFGDYYGSAYIREGYHPWYEARDNHDWYDPIFVHEQWVHRDDRQWVDHEREAYDLRRDDRALRPARTYDAMRAQAARLPEKDRREVQVARPMKEVVSEKTTPFKYNTVDAKSREASTVEARDVHAYKDKRAQWESPSPPAAVVPDSRAGTPPRGAVVVTPRGPTGPPPRALPTPPGRNVSPGERPQPPDRGAVTREPPVGPDVQGQKVKIPKSPTVVREPIRDKDLTPPPKPKQPNTDPNARPRPSRGDTPDRSRDRGGSDRGGSDRSESN